ncbi:unnamed protein product [Prunus brigantina]
MDIKLRVFLTSVFTTDVGALGSFGGAVRIFVQRVGMVRELAYIFLSLRFGKFPKLDFCVMGLTKVRRVVDITAIHGIPRPLIHVRAVRRKGCVVESNPSPHGGRGALPSEGGSPSDLLFLAGGGSASSLFSFCVY